MDSPYAWQELARLSSRPFSSDALVVVLAAHPDDETIGAASLLLEMPRCVVIHLTDGAPHDRRFWPKGQRGDRRAYAHVRRAEAVAALGHAGILPKSLLSFACADQAASRHLATLTRGFAQLLETLQAQIVITHPYEGGHPDHDAAAFVAANALSLQRQRSRSAPSTAPTLIEMTSYHAVRDAMQTGEFLPHQSHEIWTRELSHAERARKRSMLRAYTSQRTALTAFGVERERFRVAPSYDFAAAPHPGILHYERMGWLLGSDWRGGAHEALQRLGLAPVLAPVQAHARHA